MTIQVNGQLYRCQCEHCQQSTPPVETETPGTLKKRWMREQIIALRKENAALQERIREWDKVRSKFRELYMECADILDLPALRDYEDDDEFPVY